jgi:hypothetical protein
MANFEDIKQKAVDTAGTIADKSVELAKAAADKAKDLAKIAKLTTEIGIEKDGIRKNYNAIGKLYYELHKDDAEDALSQAVAEITAGYETIAAKQAEIEDVKAKDIEIVIEAETEATDVPEEEAQPEEEPEAPAEEAPADAPAEE